VKRLLSLTLTVLLSLVILSACSKTESSPVEKYLGDYSYSEPAVCMVYEAVEGEFDENGNPFYGIQYRKINDLSGILGSGNTIMIYFYSSMSDEAAAVTASVEDMAQRYNGKLIILMLDAMEYREYMDRYEIDAVPEFVLVKAGQEDKVFNSLSYEYWTISDVENWLHNNGAV